MQIHYDPKSDYIEITYGEIKPSYYENIGHDTFERRDEETDEITGYKIFNVKNQR